MFDHVTSRRSSARRRSSGRCWPCSRPRASTRRCEIANDTRYGLTGAVYSNSIERLDRAKHEYHCGNLYLNRGCTGALVGVHPFGGFNLSGTDSKAGGPDYLMNFTQGKTTSERITVPRMPGIGV